MKTEEIDFLISSLRESRNKPPINGYVDDVAVAYGAGWRDAMNAMMLVLSLEYEKQKERVGGGD